VDVAQLVLQVGTHILKQPQQAQQQEEEEGQRLFCQGFAVLSKLQKEKDADLQTSMTITRCLSNC